MAGWYVRRGEKVIGPVDSAKLKELAATGKLLPTDELAKDAAGPWTEARRTSLFSKRPPELPPGALAPKVEPPPLAAPGPPPFVPPSVSTPPALPGAESVSLVGQLR